MKKFLNNDRVVFLGDSLTNNALWISAIYQYYQDYVDPSVRMYNCGTAGGTARGAWLYRNVDLYRFDPTHVHIMFGVNDIGRGYYRTEATKEEIRKREELMGTYRNSLISLVDELLSKNIIVTFCTPVPYDADALSDSENLAGCAGALLECSQITRGICNKYKLEYIDFNRDIYYIKTALRQRDGKLSVISGDRVHPTETGYMCMARIFLRAQGFLGVAFPTADMIQSGEVAMPIGAKISELREASFLYRKLIAVEWMLLTSKQYEEYFEKPEEVRIAGMKAAMEKFNENNIDYFKVTSKFYIENLHNKEQYFRDILELTDKVLASTLTKA